MNDCRFGLSKHECRALMLQSAVISAQFECDFAGVSMKRDKMNRDFVSEHVHVHLCHKQECFFFFIARSISPAISR